MRRKVMVLFITIVVSLLAVMPAMAAPALSPSESAAAAPGYHMVRVGETLFSIGRLYGVNAWAIASANGLKNPNRIYAGQWLYIPHGGYAPHPGPGPKPGPGPYPGPGFRCHVVRFGETLSSIGRLYGRSPWSIAAANGIYNLNYIYAGQRLVIPS
jgi:LysM repeat protein